MNMIPLQQQQEMRREMVMMEKECTSLQQQSHQHSEDEAQPADEATWDRAKTEHTAAAAADKPDVASEIRDAEESAENSDEADALSVSEQAVEHATIGLKAVV